MCNNQIKTILINCPAQHLLKIVMQGLMVAGLAWALSGCGDSPQADKSTGTGGGSDLYAGAGPNTPDVDAFKTAFWEPLRAANRCGSCHDDNQVPMFVNTGNVNDAYDAAINYVNVTDPANSVFVTKVGAGHNCWLGGTNESNRACADIITRYINNWLGAESGAGRSIILTAPVNPPDPGTSKNFPALATDGNPSFQTTVYPLLRDNCSGCHAPNAASPQAPFFADANDMAAAYEAAKAKMDLMTPENSRFVLRLRNEFHNCWTSGSGGCDADADEMRDAIIAFAGGITAVDINQALLTSKAMRLQDAIIASGGSRYETNMIALWEFKEGTGQVARDTSAPPDGGNPVDLQLNGAQWVSGYGLEFSGAGIAIGADTSKLYNYIIQTGAYSVEAWVVPANVTQDDRSIVTYSDGSDLNNRNFTMGQSMYNYDFINQSTTTSGSDNDKLSTADADEDLQATLQHVVMSFDPINGRQIFVNGASTGDADPDKGGNIAGWDSGYPLVVGGEQFGSQWSGKVRMLAIYNSALTAEQVRQNYSVGVGQKYLLLFSLAGMDANVPDTSYIMFEVEQYDNYSYLFSSPKFINLDSNWTPSTAISIRGMRLGVNGREAVSGQAFANMNEVINSTQYTAEGQLLSGLGTLVAVESVNDEFFLTFEHIGTTDTAYDYTEADPATPQAPADAEMVSHIGVRTFDEINATMSAVTGVPVTNAQVKAKFDLYRRQLPAVENVEAYLSSHQMAVAQLAMKYCDVLVETTPAYFSPFNFSQVPSVAFANTTGRNNVLNPLLASIMNTHLDAIPGDSANSLGSQPSETAVRDMLASDTRQVLGDGYTQSVHEFDSLMDCMTRCERGLNECQSYVVGSNDTASCANEVPNDKPERTKQVVKATCAAVLGSAVMMIQ